MKVGLIDFELTTSGGEQQQTLEFAKGLRELGHEVSIYAYRYSPAHCYPELAREFDIHAVHVWRGEQPPNWRSTSLGALSVAVRRYFLESRHFEHFLGSVDVLGPQGRPAHRAAVFLKRRTGIPIVWNCNDVVGWELAGYRARMRKSIHRIAARVMQPLEKQIVREIDTITVLSSHVQHVLEAAYGRGAHVVHAGINTSALGESVEGRRRIRCALRIPDDAFLFLWFGVLDPFRRLEDLIEAMRRLPSEGRPARCLIVGRSDAARSYTSGLKRSVSQYGLSDRVHFVEQSIPEAQVADYYSACDAFVFPNDQQSWGLAPLEALVCRRPVIVSRGSGVQEVLRDGETALLVPPRDPEALARAMALMMSNRELATRIAERGRKLVLGQLTWRHFTAAMAELMERACRRARAAMHTVSPATHNGAPWTTRLIANTEPFWRIR